MREKPSILFINQHYWPDFASTAQHLTDLAEYLVSTGFEVHVLCSRGHYLAGSMEVPAEDMHNGVHIHRVRATAFGRDTTVGRLADYGSFFSSTLVKVLTGRSYDYVISLTTPPLLPIIGRILKAVRGQQYGIWSMDLHPDAEVASGMFDGDGLLAKVLHAINNAGYRNADLVVDLGEYMKERIVGKGVEPDQLQTIPVWSDKDEVYPISHEENPLREELGLEHKFVVMYSGNAGIAHRFDEVLQVMKRLDGHSHIEFLFVGEGPKKEKIQSFAATHELSNFRYLSYFPRDQIKYSLSIADVHLLTLRKEMAGIAVPGKLYGIMAAGRPVIMVGPEESESAATIRRHETGDVIDPSTDNDAVQSFYDSVMEMYVRTRECRRLGSNGRSAFLEEFSKDVCCEQWRQVLGGTVAEAAPREEQAA